MGLIEQQLKEQRRIQEKLQAQEDASKEDFEFLFQNYQKSQFTQVMKRNPPNTCKSILKNLRRSDLNNISLSPKL